MTTVKFFFDTFTDDENFHAKTGELPIRFEGLDTGESYFFEVSVINRSVRVKKFVKDDYDVRLIWTEDFTGGLVDVVGFFKDKGLFVDGL